MRFNNCYREARRPSDPPGTMSSFFTLPASQRKRKREDRAAAPGSKKRGVATGETERGRGAKDRDESISGSESEDDEGPNRGLESEEEESSSESENEETAAERRLRLAERYLGNVREEVDEVGFDAEEIDRDLIAERLKEDVVCTTAGQSRYWTKLTTPLG